MKRLWNRKTLLLAGFVIVLAALLLAGLSQPEHTTAEICTYLSDDGAYSLILYQIGEPEGSFGNTHCKAELHRGSTMLSTKAFDMACDGASVHPYNFSVSWFEDHVTIRTNGEERISQIHTLAWAEE